MFLKPLTGFACRAETPVPPFRVLQCRFNLCLACNYQQDAKELKELQAKRKKEQEEQQQDKKTIAPKTLTANVGFEFATPVESAQTKEANRPSSGLLSTQAAPNMQTA